MKHSIHTALVSLMLGMVLAGGAVPCAAATAGPAWEVETVYHPRLPGAATITAQWRFEVVARDADPAGEWWHVRVRSGDGQFPTEADFRLQPATGQLGSVHVREYFRDEWHEYPVLQEEPTGVFLMPFSLIPLDYVGRAEVAGKAAARESRRTVSWDAPLAARQAVRRHLEIAAGAPDAVTSATGDAGEGHAVSAPWLTYRITDSLAPGDEGSMTWDRDLPWWLECRSPGRTSRLVAWYPRGMPHAE